MSTFLKALSIAAVTLALHAHAQVHVEEIAPVIRRFRQISPSIYAGANPTSGSRGKGIELLKDAGIKTIINLQGGDIDGSWMGYIAGKRQPGEWPLAIAAEKAYCDAHGIEFINAPLNSREPKSEAEDQDIRNALAAMAAATPESPVYVHCEHGADRTGLLVALYRVTHQGWKVEEAVREWRANGHSRVSRVFTGHLDVYFYKAIGLPHPSQARHPGFEKLEEATSCSRWVL